MLFTSASSAARIRYLEKISFTTKQESIELERTIDPAIPVLVSLSYHLVDLIVCQFLADRGHDMTEFCCRDETVVVAVEDFECFSDLLL